MATYYVDTAVGNDGNAGTSEGAGNAWATIDHAMNTLSAGDHIYVKASGDYTEMATIDTAGTASASVIIEGYTSTPGDGGMATIDATGLNNGIFYTTSTYQYYAFRNITVENADYDGWNLSSRYLIMFENCQALNCGIRGFDTGGFTSFVDCVATGNSSDGIYAENDIKVIGGDISGNGGYGVRCPGYSGVAFGVMANSNASIGLQVRRGGTAINCTVDGDSKDTGSGVDFSGYSDFTHVLVNTIIYDCVNGINGDATPCNGFAIGRNNLINGNTNQYVNWETDAQATDITDAPGFTAEGSDYTLGASSAARNAGYDGSGSSSPGMDIGAHQSADAGGGGVTTVVITG